MKILDKIKKKTDKNEVNERKVDERTLNVGKILIQNRFLTFEDFSLQLSASGLACGAERGELVK